VILNVNTTSPVPPYEQIREQISSMVGSGVLPSGTRLPTIRQLARDLGLAGGTVARAYRELESNGAIETRGRHGTFVLGVDSKASPDASGLLEEAARSLVMRARQLGADQERTLAALRSAFATSDTNEVPSA